MRVMGVDPGLARTGFGVLERRGGDLICLEVGTIRADKDQPVATQLLNLCLALERVMEEHRPDAVAVERLFVNKNVQTALRVGQASGVALLAAAESGVPVIEYTPTEVKQAVTGVGNATKDQVLFMVRRLVSTPVAPDSPDAADALALAICHAHLARTRARLEAAP